jgi:hypothetical protein
MPYVAYHLSRYKSSTKRSLQKHSATLARRRLVLEATGKGGEDTALATLTPKERLARKKELEQQRREVELQVIQSSPAVVIQLSS